MSSVRWLKALPYKVNIDEINAAITTLLVEEIDMKAQCFGTFEEAKAIITTTFKTTIVDRKKNKMMKRVIEEFGEGDEEDNEDEVEQGQGPLLITQGKGEENEDESEDKAKR